MLVHGQMLFICAEGCLSTTRMASIQKAFATEGSLAKCCSSVAETEADAGPEAAGEELPPPIVSSAPAAAQVRPAAAPQAARLDATAESGPVAPLVQDAAPGALAGRGPADALSRVPEVDAQHSGLQGAVGSAAGAVASTAEEQEHSLGGAAPGSPARTDAAVAVAEQVQHVGGSTLSSPAGLEAAAAVAEQLISLVTAVTASVASPEQESLQAALPSGEQVTGCEVAVQAVAALSSDEAAGQAGSPPSSAPMEVEQAVAREACPAGAAPAAVVSEQPPGPGHYPAAGDQERAAEAEAALAQPCRAAASAEQPAQEAEHQDANETGQAAEDEEQRQAVESEEQPAQEEAQQQGAGTADLAAHDQEEQRGQEPPQEEFCQMCGRWAGLRPSGALAKQKPDGHRQTVAP